MHYRFFCPKCNNTDMTFEDVTGDDDGGFIQSWNCKKCGTYGHDNFTLSARSVWDEEDQCYDRY